jgi:hypothetical protein
MTLTTAASEIDALEQRVSALRHENERLRHENAHLRSCSEHAANNALADGDTIAALAEALETAVSLFECHALIAAIPRRDAAEVGRWHGTARAALAQCRAEGEGRR